MAPTPSCPPRPLPEVKDPDYSCASDATPAFGVKLSQSGLASSSGFPSVFCPAGFTADGLPISLAFVGRPYSEPGLLGLAFSYEQATNERRPPKTVPPLK